MTDPEKLMLKCIKLRQSVQVMHVSTGCRNYQSKLFVLSVCRNLNQKATKTMNLKNLLFVNTLK